MRAIWHEQTTMGVQANVSSKQYCTEKFPSQAPAFFILRLKDPSDTFSEYLLDLIYFKASLWSVSTLRLQHNVLIIYWEPDVRFIYFGLLYYFMLKSFIIIGWLWPLVFGCVTAVLSKSIKLPYGCQCWTLKQVSSINPQCLDQGWPHHHGLRSSHSVNR